MARLTPEQPPAGPASERLVFEALRDLRNENNSAEQELEAYFNLKAEEAPEERPEETPETAEEKSPENSETEAQA